MKKLVLLWALVAFLLAGCAAENSRVMSPAASGPAVVFLDDQVGKIISFLNHRQQRLPSNHVEITLQCLNHSKTAAWVDWKIVFLDQQGFSLEETEWQREYFAPGEIRVLQANSLKTNVDDYQVLVRLPPAVK